MYNPVPLFYTRPAPQEQRARSEEFLRRMRTRRSIRQFSTEPVPFALIANAVAAAGTAPSGANQQPWTFVVVADPAVKREIRAAAEAEEQVSYAERMSEEWLRALAPLGTDWHKPHIEEAPCVSRSPTSTKRPTPLPRGRRRPRTSRHSA